MKKAKKRPPSKRIKMSNNISDENVVQAFQRERERERERVQCTKDQICSFKHFYVIHFSVIRLIHFSWEVTSSIPGRDIPKSLKKVLQ